jgi:hypothetical protein
VPASDSLLLDCIRAERVLDAYDNALDREEWDAVRRCLASDVRYDLSAVDGSAAELLEADTLLARLRVQRREGRRYQHMRMNHETLIEGGTAIVRSKRYSIRVDDSSTGSALLESWTTYEHHLERSDGEWAITEIRGTLAHRREADPGVPR